MNSSTARQEIAMKLKTKGRLRVAIGAVACAATIAVMPLSALARTSAVSDTVLCASTCKPAAAFDRAALLANGGVTVLVSGPITCRVGDSVRIRATVSQASTGAVARMMLPTAFLSGYLDAGLPAASSHPVPILPTNLNFPARRIR